MNRSLFCVLLQALSASDAMAAPPVFHLEEIPRLAQLQIYQPKAINNKGEVTGEAYSEEHGFVCFKYSGGVTIELPDSAGQDCVGINDRGIVVGHDTDQAYVWKPNAEKQKLEGMKWAFGINRAGHVVGTIDVGRIDYRAGLYIDGVVTDLGLLDGKSSYSEGLALNDKDVAVGYGDGKPGFIRGIRWRNGKATAISYDDITTAEAINNKGHIAGKAGHDSGSWGAYFMDETGLHPLPMLKGMETMTPHSINERDEIVGTMHSALNRDIAFYSFEGRSYWLLGLLDEESRAHITAVETAWAINDAGQIVGMAFEGRYGFPFIATPVTPARPSGTGLAAER